MRFNVQHSQTFSTIEISPSLEHPSKGDCLLLGWDNSLKEDPIIKTCFWNCYNNEMCRILSRDVVEAKIYFTWDLLCSAQVIFSYVSPTFPINEGKILSLYLKANIKKRKPFSSINIFSFWTYLRKKKKLNISYFKKI